MRAWGFEPSSIAFVWIKPTRKAFANGGFFLDETLFAKGMGHTTRQNAEYVVLAGEASRAGSRKDVHQLIIQPRREHSRKPDEFYARVERYCTGPYLELFARQRRPGWTAWGDETRQVRTRIRRPRRLRQIARGGLSRHSRARCGRRPKVGAEMTRRAQPEAAAPAQRDPAPHMARARPACLLSMSPMADGDRESRARSSRRSAPSPAFPTSSASSRAGVYALEFKAERGRLTDVQRVVHERLREAGAHVAVAHGSIRRSRSSRFGTCFATMWQRRAAATLAQPSASLAGQTWKIGASNE